jgi:hypothetical protein
MSSTKSYLFIVVLITLNVVVLYKLYHSRMDIKNLKFRIDKKNEQIVSIKNTFYKLESSKMAADRLEGSDCIENFPNIVKTNEPILIFRIHENNCNDCVEQALQKLEEVRRHRNINIIILAKYPSLSSVRLNFKINFPTYIFRELKQDSLANTKPYFFVLKNGKMENVFFPDWEMPELLSNYIGRLKIYQNI